MHGGWVASCFGVFVDEKLATKQEKIQIEEQLQKSIKLLEGNFAKYMAKPS